MEKILEKLWNEYLAEECAEIDTEEERSLVKKAAEMHKSVNESLTKAQSDAMEKYVESLYEIQSFCLKKVFLRGCKFATCFFLEVISFGE